MAGDTGQNTGRSSRLTLWWGLGGGVLGALAVLASGFAMVALNSKGQAPSLSVAGQPAAVRPLPAAPTLTLDAASATAAVPPAPSAVDEFSDRAPEVTPPAPQSDTAAAPVVLGESASAAATPATARAPSTPAPSTPAPTSPPVATPTATPAPVVAVVLSTRERGLLEAMNQQRAANGLASLEIAGELTDAARVRSDDMMRNNYFAHVSPLGQTWYAILQARGLSFTAGGENLAKVGGDDSRSVGVAVDMLMRSPTHRDNILQPLYRKVGVGAVSQGDGMTIFTTIFTDR